MTISKKIFIIACEPSADGHGASLVKELKRLAPESTFRGLGGPLMAQAGVSLIEDMTKISALGFGDVLRQYFRYRKIFYNALREANSFKPDAVILIDSPAFNLRFAKKINRRFPVIYYIAPQIWAWGGQRIHTIKKFVSKMITILPFEKKIYDDAGVPCDFVGHPLLDHLGERSRQKIQLRKDLEITDQELAIGLLPGSRASEVKRILPEMLRAADLIKQKFPQASFFLTESPNVPKEVYANILSHHSSSPHGVRRGSQILDSRLKSCGNDKIFIRRMRSRMQDVVAAMDFALIASGTATLEAALLGTPFFLLYKASVSTYWLGRLLIKVKFLGMVNLLAGRAVVPEFIQGEMRGDVIAAAATEFLSNQVGQIEVMKNDFAAVTAKVGNSGASRRAAESIISFLSQNAPTQIQAGQQAHSAQEKG